MSEKESVSENVFGFPRWYESGCHFQEQVGWGTWLRKFRPLWSKLIFRRSCTLHKILGDRVDQVFWPSLNYFKVLAPQRPKIFFRRLPPKNVKLSPALCSVCHARGHHHHLVDLHLEDENSLTMWRDGGLDLDLVTGQGLASKSSLLFCFQFKTNTELDIKPLS